MADTQTENKPKAEKSEDALTVSRERLVSESEGYFNEPPYVVVAALTLLDGRKQNFTIPEVEAKIAAVRKGTVDMSATSEV